MPYIRSVTGKIIWVEDSHPILKSFEDGANALFNGFGNMFPQLQIDNPTEVLNSVMREQNPQPVRRRMKFTPKRFVRRKK